MNAAHGSRSSARRRSARAAAAQVDNRPAEWGYISPAIFQPNCATTSCHSPAAAVSGLDFSTPENGYASLTQLWVWVVFPPDGGTPAAPGTPCAIGERNEGLRVQERPLVTPYDPAGSRVVNMLRARDAPRMPPDRPLPEADIELVERWILNGALEYPNGQPVQTRARARRRSWTREVATRSVDAGDARRLGRRAAIGGRLTDDARRRASACFAAARARRDGLGCSSTPAEPSDPAWADVAPIFRGECNSCHGWNAGQTGGGYRFDFFDVTHTGRLSATPPWR